MILFANYTLAFALALSLLQIVLSVMSVKKNYDFLSIMKRCVLSQTILILSNFFLLIYCFVSDDRSVAYVAYHSSLDLPVFFKVCALWSAHEGSLLLWILIQTIWMSCFAYFFQTKHHYFKVTVLGVMAFINIFFYVFILFISNPWLYNNNVIHGSLTPVLQDYGLSIHPPILYFGYVGTIVIFSAAISILLNPKWKDVWNKRAINWVIIPWIFLTLGIILGSWWAYRELGWGGWWFWDPVENASFLPWISMTALIHLFRVKKNNFDLWIIFLSLITFALSLIGTFLVRSGALISVHSFANSHQTANYILFMISIIIGLSYLLFFIRGKKFSINIPLIMNKRNLFLLSSSGILFLSILIILIGTTFPILARALNYGEVVVGAPYFDIVFKPLLIIALILMNFYFVIVRKLRVKDCILVYSISIFVALILAIIIDLESISLFFLLNLSVLLIFNIVNINSLIFQSKLNQKQCTNVSMHIAHLGVSVSIIAAVLSLTLQKEIDLPMKIGNEVKISGYKIKFNQVDTFHKDNYQVLQARFGILNKNNDVLDNLYPSQKFFATAKTVMSQADISTNVFRDIYIVFGQQISKGTWAIKIYYKPFIRWIWVGGFLIIFSGLMTLFKSMRNISIRREVRV
ncbi:heme lyase CcmF/NrfE family subunit [Paraphotobacterium marinum]|nr:cytochrome c-type biogenesis CcmF C-terminal domain-containing protein [Paraphotobacterium marinum]